MQNIVSVCWTDHLTMGEGDGQLKTIDALKRRMEQWRANLGTTSLLWRQSMARKDGKFTAAPGSEQAIKIKRKSDVDWDDFDVVPELSHQNGMQAYLYVPILDEGRPLPSESERKVSYHNKGHGQDLAWQSNFTIANPEYITLDKSLENKQWGVLSLAYPEVRNHLVERFTKLLDGYDFDGLFICFRSQSRPPDFADEFGFNTPIRNDYLERYGKDIWKDEFDLQAWRDLQGEYLTELIAQIREATNKSGHRLAIGCARGDVLGHPLGNTSIHWRKWIERGLIDQLVINQDSSRCPSMWIDLWPMHRGGGYTQDYLRGADMAPLDHQLTNDYGPALDGNSTELYVARQWNNRSESEERSLLAHPAVSGLVYSSFRYDNAEKIGAHQGNWDL